MRAIVPIELVVESVDGTWKLNQKKADEVRLCAEEHVAAVLVSSNITRILTPSGTNRFAFFGELAPAAVARWNRGIEFVRRSLKSVDEHCHIRGQVWLFVSKKVFYGSKIAS